jgi:hypothetical protein
VLRQPKLPPCRDNFRDNFLNRNLHAHKSRRAAPSKSAPETLGRSVAESPGASLRATSPDPGRRSVSRPPGACVLKTVSAPRRRGSPDALGHVDSKQGVGKVARSSTDATPSTFPGLIVDSGGFPAPNGAGQTLGDIEGDLGHRGASGIRYLRTCDSAHF